RQHGYPVSRLCSLMTGQLLNRGHNVPKRGNMIACSACSNVILPAKNEWSPDASFIQVALIAFQSCGAVKKVRISAAFPMRAVVAAKDYNGVFGQAVFFQFSDDFTNVMIH